MKLDEKTFWFREEDIGEVEVLRVDVILMLLMRWGIIEDYLISMSPKEIFIHMEEKNERR